MYIIFSTLQTIDWLFTVSRPTQEFLTYMETLAYARRSGPLSREGSLSYHTCCDRDLRFSGLIRRISIALFSRLLQHTRGCGGSILTRILTGPNTLGPLVWSPGSDPGDASGSVSYLFQEFLSRRPTKRWFRSPGKFRADSKWLKHFLKHRPGQNRAMKQMTPVHVYQTRSKLSDSFNFDARTLQIQLAVGCNVSYFTSVTYHDLPRF
jgi:hypothetical protein